MPELALYQPDIPQNTGTLIRLGACLDIPVHIIGPAGFDMSDRNLKRAGMDYIELATVRRHIGWTSFCDWATANNRRIVLATTKTDASFIGFSFQPHDIVLMGRESAGVPEDVADFAHAKVTIPMRPGLRSLNIAVAGAMILTEALRQTAHFTQLAKG